MNNSMSICDNFTNGVNWDVNKVNNMLDEIMDYFESLGYIVSIRYGVFKDENENLIN